jgi:hypothetical protein
MKLKLMIRKFVKPLKILIKRHTHRCTVVGNPGGRGPWFFLANSFEGGTWGCEKISGEGGRFYFIFILKF